MKKILLLTVVLALGLSLGADKLVIVSPNQKTIQDEWIPAFKAWYQTNAGKAVEIEWLDQGGTSDDLKFITSNFAKSPEGIKVDLFWGGGTTPYFMLKQKGLLQKYEVPAEQRKTIPASIGGILLYDPEYYWYGSAVSSFGIAYNKPVLKMLKLPEPATWEDLARPEYQGWVGCADPRHSGSMNMIYSIMFQAYGWEKGWRVATLMGANAKSFTRQSTEILKNVCTGETAVGLSIDFYAWSKILEVGADNIGFVLPEGLTAANADAIAILKGAPNLDVAKKFIEFNLSEEGQCVWLLNKGEPGGPKINSLSRLSVRPELYEKYAGKLAVSGNPFKMKNFISYDNDKGDKLREISNDLMGALFVDTREELQQAWKKLIAAGCPEDKVKELCRMPLTEEEALKLAESWKDQKVRNDKINEWVRFAKEKYERLAR